MLQQREPDHCNDDRGKHQFDDNKIFQQQLAGDHVIIRHTAFLEEEPKHDANTKTNRELGLVIPVKPA